MEQVAQANQINTQAPATGSLEQLHQGEPIAPSIPGAESMRVPLGPGRPANAFPARHEQGITIPSGAIAETLELVLSDSGATYTTGDPLGLYLSLTEWSSSRYTEPDAVLTRKDLDAVSDILKKCGEFGGIEEGKAPTYTQVYAVHRAIVAWAESLGKG